MRFIAGVISLFVLTAIVSLSAWAVLPRIALGWHGAAITSDSMSPAIQAGDVVLAQPHDGSELEPGSVVVFEDPSQPGYVTHRISAALPDGTYVTKGDANPRVDSTPLVPADIVGVGRLLVPLAGHPVMWYSHGQWVTLIAALAMLAAVMWTSPWAFRYDPWSPGIDQGPRGQSGDRSGAARSPAVFGVVALLALGLPSASRAAFADSTANPANSTSAAPHFSSFRVSTYEVADGTFTGTTYTLTLDQNLAVDYFVMLRGAAGANDGGTNRSPDQDYVRVTGDPHSNFGTVTSATELELSREAAASSWQGQVTVVESAVDGALSGFKLLDVVEVNMATGITANSGTSIPGWSDINQVGLYGGVRGGGVATTSAVRPDHMTAWGRIYPSGSGTVNVERMAGGGGNLSGATVFTTYVIEWGTEWTIQRATVSGSAGGNGMNLTGHYDTSAIAAVSRDNTFLVAYGTSTDNGLGDGWEGQVFTLGDGVAQLAVETTVAVGGEYADSRTAEVYVHSHPMLAVDYRFGTDGGSPGIPTSSLTGTVPIDGALGPETYFGGPGVLSTGGYRLTVLGNSSNGAGNAYPRPLAWSRPTASATATWTRSRTGQRGAFWLQSVDFANIRS